MTADLTAIFKLRARIETEARRWWESKRPIGWTVEQHLEHPRVNATSSSEIELALAIATAVRAELLS